MAATDIIFSNSSITAMKLNLMIRELNDAIAAAGGGGTGDMTKAVYDVNNNGIVDTADAIAWTAVTGKPSTFPPDSTAMLKSVYDTNNNGKADTCDSLPWGSVTGKPATFPPDATAMLKSVYDTNGDGISDHAALADMATSANAVPWTGVTGKPSTFPPDSTAELVAHKGVASGYAGLDTTGKVPAAQLPAFGTGDMTKAVYDTNNNGVVDTADAIAWGSVTGKPTTFPPDSTAMLKSVYDTNNDGISDHAALADTATTANAVAWTGVTGKPATFAPSAHATTHLDNGADAIPVATTTRTGLLTQLNGNSTTFLNGTGAFAAIPGGGDMLKSVYDTNGNGVVDTADAIPWTSVTGKPATFPPNITIDPGAWTTPAFATGWSDGGSCAYRIQVIGSVSTIFSRGIAAQVAGGASLAFTLPSGARPAATRICQVAGYQNESDSTQSLVLYGVTVSTAGAVNIFPIIKNNAVWTSSAQSQSVYLDSLTFSL